MSDEVKGSVDLPPIDPFNMYDVAMATDRVLKIKRALEAAGMTCDVHTAIKVEIDLTIRQPEPVKKKARK